MSHSVLEQIFISTLTSDGSFTNEEAAKMLVDVCLPVEATAEEVIQVAQLVLGYCQLPKYDQAVVRQHMASVVMEKRPDHAKRIMNLPSLKTRNPSIQNVCCDTEAE